MAHQTDLTDAERRLKKSVTTDDDARPSDVPDPGSAREQGEAWGSDRTVRASFLRELLTDGGRQKGTLHISSVKVTGALDLVGLGVKRRVILENCFFADELDFEFAQVSMLTFQECKFTAFKGRQLRAESDVRFLQCDAESVELDEARIEGRLELPGTHLETDEESAFSADGARISSDLFCEDGFSAKGGFRLVGARIEGQLRFSDSKLINAGAKALTACSLYVAEDLSFNKDFVADGQVDLHGAHIGGQLSFKKATLKCDSTNHRALEADQAKFDEGVFASSTFEVEGGLFFDGATITGPLDLREAKLSAKSTAEAALSLFHAHVLFLRVPIRFTPKGFLDLQNAQIGQLEDAWPDVRYRPLLNDCSYKSLLPLTSDVSPRLEWIEASEGEYAPQPYEQLASVLRAAGNDDKAREVAIAKERARAKTLRLPGKMRSAFLGATVAYGYKPGRGLIWLAGLFVLNLAAFFWAKNDSDFRVIHDKGETLPEFHLPIFAVDHVLPVIELGQRSHWSTTGPFQYVQTLSDLAGWILVTVIIGAVTARFVRS